MHEALSHRVHACGLPHIEYMSTMPWVALTRSSPAIAALNDAFEVLERLYACIFCCVHCFCCRVQCFCLSGAMCMLVGEMVSLSGAVASGPLRTVLCCWRLLCCGQVEGIPMLVLVSPSGKVQCTDARARLEADPEGFPWPKKPVEVIVVLFVCLW